MAWRNLLKAAWIVACLTVMAWTAIACGQETDPTFRGECSLLAGYLMVLLTLPSGLIWLSLASAIAYALFLVGIESRGPSLIGDFIVWLGFFVFGYIQWFHLMPLLLAKWRLRRGA